MPRESSLPGRSVVVAKVAVLATMTVLAVVPVSTSARQVTAEKHGDSSVAQTRTDRLIERHDCSTTGFGPAVDPRSALVLRDGRIRHVSFEQGWAVYTGAAHGSFVALCRGD